MEHRTRLQLAEKMVKVGVIKDTMTFGDWIFHNLTDRQEQELLIKLYEVESFKVFE